MGMTAVVDGVPVTPRRGKAVEINALWYNALCLLRDWLAAELAALEAAWLAPAVTALEDRVVAEFVGAQGTAAVASFVDQLLAPPAVEGVLDELGEQGHDDDAHASFP